MLHKHAGHILMHFASDSAVLRKYARHGTFVHGDQTKISIVHAAMNPNDGAIETCDGKWTYFGDPPVLPWIPGAGVNALRRAVARAESRKFRIACAKTLRRNIPHMRCEMPLRDVLECADIVFGYECRADPAKCEQLIRRELRDDEGGLCRVFGDAMRDLLLEHLANAMIAAV